MLLWSIWQVTQKASSFEWVLEQKVLQQVHLAVQVALPLGPYDPINSQWYLRYQCQVGMLFRAFRARFYDHLQITVLPLRDSSWALVETGHLTMGHQATMRPWTPFMSWVLSDPSIPRVACAQQQSTIGWKWYRHDWA